MKTKLSQGFGAVEVLAVVVVVALLGVVSYKFWDVTHRTDMTASTSSSVSKVKTPSDLNKVSDELDAVDVSSSFEADLNTAGSF